jgi:class 3 adenylate cyclase
MPLFMDRHDLPGVTAEQVAAAHSTDIQIESKHGVTFLAYWFDADHGEVFCLARAATPDDMQAVHREGHGLVPNEIIAVSEDDVLRFLGKVNDPVDPARAPRAFRTILFTDLMGSTVLLQDVGEAAFMGLLAEHDVIIRRALVTWQGREVKHTGAASAVQDGFEARRSAGAERDLRVRIGIAAGEPVDHNDDLFGATVNLASRICDVAEPGHVLTADIVRDMGIERGFSFGPARDVDLKGFGRVQVFELVWARG